MTDVLTRIQDHPKDRLEDLLPGQKLDTRLSDGSLKVHLHTQSSPA
ncbi:transposase domain-containing protein [Agrobacterium salinitolerans]|nr:transposase domain-containing protein [Agrobacterium salinitolerans]